MNLTLFSSSMWSTRTVAPKVAPIPTTIPGSGHYSLPFQASVEMWSLSWLDYASVANANKAGFHSKLSDGAPVFLLLTTVSRMWARTALPLLFHPAWHCPQASSYEERLLWPASFFDVFMEKSRAVGARDPSAFSLNIHSGIFDSMNKLEERFLQSLFWVF